METALHSVLSAMPQVAAVWLVILAVAVLALATLTVPGRLRAAVIDSDHDLLDDEPFDPDLPDRDLPDRDALGSGRVGAGRADTGPDGSDRAGTARADVTRTESIDTQPIDTQPIDTQPIDTQPTVTRPVDTDSIDTEPVGVGSVGVDLAGEDPAGGNSAGADAAGTDVRGAGPAVGVRRPTLRSVIRRWRAAVRRPARKRASTDDRDWAHRYADEITIAAERAAITAQRRRAEWERAHDAVDETWAAFDAADRAARRFANAAAFPVRGTRRRRPEEIADRER